MGRGEFAPGRLLPSESELAAAYEASRVTIRRALEQLRGEGLVDARQGFGWFAAGDPVRQRLARLGTIEGQITERGVRSERRILSFNVVAPPKAVAVDLGRGKVLEVERLNLADGHPFARVTVWCPERLARKLTREQLSEHTFYDLLPEVIKAPLGGAVQTIGAAAASKSDAELLEVPLGSPVLICRRVTSDGAGTPVLVAVYVFPGHRTEFVVDLPNPEASMAPSGLRLVD